MKDSHPLPDDRHHAVPALAKPVDPALVASVITILRQGEWLLEQLDNEKYVRQLPVTFGSSIGGHYRHCLDHFRGLLSVVVVGDLNYDRRERGTPVEKDRGAALQATQELQAGFQQWAANARDRHLLVTCKTSYPGHGSEEAVSSVGREIMYVVAHAVHHYALIRIMSGLMGINLPPEFGMASSTLQHQADLAAGVSR